MKRAHHTTSALTGILLIASIGCGTGAPEQQAPATNGIELMSNALEAALPDMFGTEHLYVPKSELMCAMADFDGHLHQGDSTSHAPIPMPEGGIQVQCSALLTALDGVEPCTPTGPIERGVVVHYGLTADSEFDVRLQLLCLTYNETSEEYEYAASDDCYAIKTDGTLQFIAGGLAAWKSTGGWNRYVDRVLIQSDNSSPWKRIDTEVEPNSAIHGEDVVRALIEENELGEGKLDLVPIATPQYRVINPDSSYDERGYHQGLAWVPADIQLDDSTYADAPFKAKALDVGSPCPHACPMKPFAFWTRGTAPRHGCP